MLNFLKRYDLYIKPHQDFQIKTAHGGLVTLLAIVLTVSLFLAELTIYLTPEVISDMRVDTSRKSDLPINLDITFPKAPCDALSFSYIDVAGRSQLNLEHSMMKQALDRSGAPINEESQRIIIDQAAQGAQVNATVPVKEDSDRNEDQPDTECGSCYGAETMKQPCCNTCQEVENAYRLKGWRLTEKDKISQCIKENPDLLNSWGARVKKAIKDGEGCRLHGEITVNRVAGSLYIAPGGTTLQEHGTMVHKYPGMEGQGIYDFIYSVDHTHEITEFRFGEHQLDNQEDPLSGVKCPKESATTEKTPYSSKKHIYFLKIVPSTYHSLKKNDIKNSAQYSMTQHSTDVTNSGRLPGIWFEFSISPMLVRYKESKRSLTHFLTSIVAIIGGIFAVAGLIDSTLYRTFKTWKKQQLGQQD